MKRTNMSLGSEGDFSYSGRLVFNGIHTTDILNAEFDFEDVVGSELTDYQEGTYSTPGCGYQIIPFQSLLNAEPEVSESVATLCDDVHTLRYLEEQWEHQEVDIDGETETRPTKTGYSSFDAYWARPDYLFVMGNKSNAKMADELLSATLEDYLDIRGVTFSPDFLLWLFSQEKNGLDLPGNISISMLTDARIEGDEPDLFGREGRVTDSTDVTKSIPVLQGILRQMGVVQLEGVFNLQGFFVHARISSEGRVHILADHAIEGSPDIERVAISVAFLQAFSELYEDWVTNTGSDKYPPEQFFVDIYEECKRQGVDIQYSIDEVIEEYRQKGGPEEYQQFQAGISDFAE